MILTNTLSWANSKCGQNINWTHSIIPSLILLYFQKFQNTSKISFFFFLRNRIRFIFDRLGSLPNKGFFVQILWDFNGQNSSLYILIIRPPDLIRADLVWPCLTPKSNWTRFLLWRASNTLKDYSSNKLNPQTITCNIFQLDEIASSDSRKRPQCANGPKPRFQYRKPYLIPCCDNQFSLAVIELLFHRN